MDESWASQMPVGTGSTSGDALPRYALQKAGIAESK